MPVSHVTDNGYLKFIRTFSFVHHQDLVQCLKKPSIEVWSYSYAASYPPPSSWKLDTTSKDSRVFLAVMVRCFEPGSFSPNKSVSAALRPWFNIRRRWWWEIVPSIPRWEWTWTVCELESFTVFSRHPRSARSRIDLGTSDFRRTCVEVALDNAGGTSEERSLFEALKRELVPDLSESWDPSSNL